MGVSERTGGRGGRMESFVDESIVKEEQGGVCGNGEERGAKSGVELRRV